MREYRFFVPSSDVDDNSVIISGDEFNHLLRVLRLNTGDRIVAISEDGILREGEILEITKKYAVAKVTGKVCVPDPAHKLTVFQALVRSDNMDLIAQKCTELGVYEFVPFMSSYCTVSKNANKRERLSKISVQACKQCGRAKLMQVSDIVDFDKMLARLGEFDLVIFAYEQDKSSLKSLLQTQGNFKNIALIIGCEGGFSPREADEIVKAGGAAVSLGRLILRAETAAIVLSGIVSYELGEFEKEEETK